MNQTKNNYRLLAEFEKHLATWIIWPYRSDTWHDAAKPARQAYATVANAIAEFEQVNVIVRKEDQPSAEELLNKSITIVNLPFDSEWARDTGPVFVKDDHGQTCGIDFAFDSWGGIYADYKLDDELASHIVKSRRYPLIINDLVLEGGSILVDGEGTLIATEECFFNSKRKVLYSKADLASIFETYFGVSKVIWIKRGVYKDTVNGHIDNLCSFVKPQVLALAWTDDTSDPQYEISKEAFDILASSTDAQGRAFEIAKIHQPDPLFVTENETKVIGESFLSEVDRLCASYVNFYIVNGGVIVPSFDDKKFDKLALETISRLFKDRKVVQIPSREILLGGGGIHCITMQEPV